MFRLTPVVRITLALVLLTTTLVLSADLLNLIPNPTKGSACKRLNLMARWMVRKDEVDPGGWDQIDTSMLIVPLDVHMHRIAIEHGLTRRKNADMRTALEVTDAFAGYSPKDPVRYDFALTRPPIGGH